MVNLQKGKQSGAENKAKVEDTYESMQLEVKSRERVINRYLREIRETNVLF
jgi:hypothetical protein